MKFMSSPSFNNLPLREVQTYTEEDINELFDLSEEESVELTKVISNQVAINKVYSSQKTEERLAEILIEANEFAIEQLGKANFLSIEIVTSESEIVDNTTIYLIDDGTNTNTYNQYMFINNEVKPLGSTSIDLSDYVTNEKLEEKLEDYAKKNEVLSASDIVTTIDENSTDTTVPSSATVKTFVEDSLPEIVTTLNNTVTDEQVSSALATYNATKDMNMKTYTTVEQLGLSYPCTVGDIFNQLPDKSMGIFCVNALSESITDVPESNGALMIHKNYMGRFLITYNLSTMGSVATNKMWIGILQGNDGTGLVWNEVITTRTNALTTYSDFAQISSTATTLSEYIQAMPNNSIASLNLQQHTSEFIGDTKNIVNNGGNIWGALFVQKINAGRIYLRLNKVGGGYHKGTFEATCTETAGYVLEWKKVHTTSVADVTKTMITFTDETNYKVYSTSFNYYRVENGQCFFYIYVKVISPTDGLSQSVCKLPIPKETLHHIVPCWNVYDNSMDTMQVTIHNNTGELCFAHGTTNATYLLYGQYPVAE